MDITNLKEFNGFEKDVDGFITAVNQLGLDFSKQNFSIRYSPVSKELRIEERRESIYQVFDENLIPIFRQEVTFFYPGDMLEFVFFFGEMDELLVIKEASFSEIINESARENNWFEKYKRSTFNKDISITDQGKVELITYSNLEKDADIRLSLGLDVGISHVGDQFPFRQELSLFFDSEKFNKRTRISDGWKSGFYFSFDLYQFFSRDSENRFLVDSSVFANVGLITGPKSNPIGIRFWKVNS